MKTALPRISVVIPTYNRMDYIEQAVESVLNQRGEWNLDIIVVDDGSTDDTKKKLNKYKNKIQYFKIPHSGLPAVARNYGIKKAAGDLIAFQDSDDQWPTNKLSIEIPSFDNSDVVMVYGQAKVMGSSGDLTSRSVVVPNKLKNGEAFSTLVKENVVSTLTVIARKDALLSVGGFNESPKLKAVEDYELWLRMSARFPKGLKNLNKVLAHYREHQGNISSADSVLALERLLNVYDQIWENEDLTDDQRNSLEKQISVVQENWSRQQNIDGNTPAISVVMGIYKDERYIKKSIQSILDQTFSDFEYLIIDDGSTDKSPEIAASFNDPRIRIIHQINHGLVYTLNQGIKLARAKIIARQDADDISLPNRFKKELAWLEANPKRAMVSSFFSYIDENTSKSTGVTITSPFKHIDIVRHMYFNNPIGHGSTLLRRQVIMDVGGYSDKYGPNEDYDLWRRIAAADWKIGMLPEVLYQYRLSSGGISSTNQKLQHELFDKLVEDIWKGRMYKKSLLVILKDGWFYKHFDSPFSDKIYKQYKSHQVRLAFEFLVHGKLWAGYKNFFAALLIYPKGAIRLWKTWLWAPFKLLLRKGS